MFRGASDANDHHEASRHFENLSWRMSWSRCLPEKRKQQMKCGTTEGIGILPMKTRRFTGVSSSVHGVVSWRSNNSCTAWSIMRRISPLTETTPCRERRQRACSGQRTDIHANAIHLCLSLTHVWPRRSGEIVFSHFVTKTIRALLNLFHTEVCEGF